MRFPPSPAQALADLRWLLLSPPLLSEQAYPGQVQRFTGAEIAAIEGWLAQVERRWMVAPSPTGEPAQHLSDLNITSYLRLGRYAEKLLSFFLRENDLGFHLVAQGISLKSGIPGGNTLGEIDFLLMNPQGGRLHWELAVKFFLCEQGVGPTAHPSDFLGPNRRDGLQNKLNKLFGKQLLSTPPLPYAEYQWHAQSFTKGRMFYHFAEVRSICSALNTKHLRGFWAYWDEIEQVQAALQKRFPAEKITWLALNRADWMSEKSAHTVVPELAQPPTEPQMFCCMFEKQVQQEASVEIARGFLIPRPVTAEP